MKKLSMLLALALIVSMCGFTASAEGTYSQAPMLDEAVEAGTLPSVEERLPEIPKITDAMLPEDLDYQIGNYGGTLTTSTASVNWDPDIFCGMNEALLTMQSQNSDVITPNIVESYEVNDENTEFTFHLRKGLKWSDGVEVTMEDFRFTIEDVIYNTTINSVLNKNFRTGGSSSGNPGVFEVIDDYTYKFTFDGTYGGFLVYLSVASWTAYADYLKPAHILKQFHPDYAEECHGSLEEYYKWLQPFGTVLGYDDVTQEDVWVYIFNQVDLSTWETTDPNDTLTSVFFEDLVDWNFPTLYPYLMTSSGGGIYNYERNPYYFKVDEAGQQLPYIDYLRCLYVEDTETQQLKYISGEATFGLETVTAVNYPLYMENAESGDYTVYTPSYHYSPVDIMINLNYGLNPDGSVKDDNESQAWQEMTTDKRFLQALMHAVDAEELIDTVYHGLGEPSSAYQCDGDYDLANALLDEMGAFDVDDDGYRETPSGLTFTWQIWNRNAATDQIPACEMYAEFWREIGLNANVYTTESSLLGASTGANEVPMRVDWAHEANLWHYRDWVFAYSFPLYNQWINAGGYSGGVPEDSTDYLKPSDEFTYIYKLVDELMAVSPTEAVNTIMPELTEYMATDLLSLIVPVTNAANCVILNSDIANVPTGGLGIALNFSMEQFYYQHPEEH